MTDRSSIPVEKHFLVVLTPINLGPYVGVGGREGRTTPLFGGRFDTFPM